MKPRLLMISTTLTIALLQLCCAAPHPLEREFDFDAAMKLEVVNDGYRLNGEPVAQGALKARVDAAHLKHGSGTRRAAVIVMALVPQSGENNEQFQSRRSTRREQALDDLRMAGVLDVHLGPPVRQEPPNKK
ncbi:MAG: hypothetical protein ACKVS6_15115 [Planctomycetota bacterium]